MKNKNNDSQVTLRIHSESMSPDEISRTLKLSPTKFYSKGEKMSSKNPLSAVFEENLWLLEFEKGTSLSELLINASNFFADNQNSLTNLLGKCTIDLFCGYSPKESQDSFFLEYDTLKKISSVPIDIIFDVYSS